MTEIVAPKAEINAEEAELFRTFLYKFNDVAGEKGLSDQHYIMLMGSFISSQIMLANDGLSVYQKNQANNIRQASANGLSQLNKHSDEAAQLKDVVETVFRQMGAHEGGQAKQIISRIIPNDISLYLDESLKL